MVKEKTFIEISEQNCLKSSWFYNNMIDILTQGCTNYRAASVITDKTAVWGAVYFLIGKWGRIAFIHFFIFHFIHLQVQPKDVEIVVKCCTMYLLNYRCQMTEYNYNTMIT
jgi:hypothetical protein